MAERALLLVCLFAFAAIAGCTATADLGGFPDDPGMMDALEAYPLALAAATEIDPDAEFLGMRGSEGVLPEGTLRFWLPVADLEDDLLADGVMGDGQVSSWLAKFRVDFGVVTVQAFADGRTEVHMEGAVEPRAEHMDEEMDGRTDASSWLVSSSAAAMQAASDLDFARHVADYPAAGYVYQYLPYSDKDPTYDWSSFFMFGGPMEEPQETGWSISGNSWLVTHFDPAAFTGNTVPTVGVAGIDAATAKMTHFEAFVPRMVASLYDGGTYEDPLVPDEPKSLRAPVHEVQFDVPVGSGTLTGFLYAYSSATGGVGIGVGVIPDQPILTLTAPDGSEAYRSGDTFGFDEIGIIAPEPGTWTLRITHERPVPQTTEVMGVIYATVPVREDTVPLFM